MINTGFQDVLGQAKRLLSESPFPALRTLRVEYDHERVHLIGSVRTYYLKQLAQETVRSATRGIDVANDVRVVGAN